jgi:RNA-directed DNA polymerase
MKYQTSYSRISKAFGIESEILYIASHNPSYTKMQIPKSNGDLRVVFAPNQNLKKAQRKIADKLNKVYSPLLPDGVMGFVKVKDWESHKRDIVSNAKLHLKSKYLVNLDIKDFFPSINTNMVKSTLNRLIKIDPECLEIVCNLLMHNGSLPPGSPASPVISNLVLLQLDKNIGTYCKSNKLIYSRYADDISISSKGKVDACQIDNICAMIMESGFQINTEKTKKYGKKDIKEVTGIAVQNKKLRLCQDTIKEISDNIDYYHDWKQRILKQYGATEMVQSKIKSMQRSIKGQLNFAKRIDGADGKSHQMLLSKYEKSIDERVFANKFYV